MCYHKLNIEQPLVALSQPFIAFQMGVHEINLMCTCDSIPRQRDSLIPVNHKLDEFCSLSNFIE